MSSRNVRFYVWNLSIVRYALPACVLIMSGLAVYETAQAKAMMDSFVPWEPHPVVVDAGHGGYDPGVKTDNANVTEKDITLAIAKKVESELEGIGISTVLTRQSDEDFAEHGTRGQKAKRQDLDYRLNVARFAGASAFVSIHVNKSSLATRGGAEVFYSTNTQGSKTLADAIQNELQKIPGMSRRDAKPETYYILRNLEIPAVIVEVGYLNLPPEQQLLPTSGYQDKLAKAISAGIRRYLEGEPSPPSH